MLKEGCARVAQSNMARDVNGRTLEVGDAVKYAGGVKSIGGDSPEILKVVDLGDSLLITLPGHFWEKVDEEAGRLQRV